MTTEENIVTETVAEPVIDTTTAARAEMEANAKAQGERDRAEHEAMLADMKKRAAEEAVIAAEQDAALAAVKAACDAEREALKQGI
jgi:hypothetical protein